MKTLTLITLLFAGQVLAQYHTHSWIKDAEWQANNGKVVCSWECISDYRNKHTRQTSGYGFCPIPY